MPEALGSPISHGGLMEEPRGEIPPIQPELSIEDFILDGWGGVNGSDNFIPSLNFRKSGPLDASCEEKL